MLSQVGVVCAVARCAALACRRVGAADPRLPSLQALKVKEFELRKNHFSDCGNFGFGIDEHIDLGIKYDPSIGIYGMDFFVVLGRKGLRVARKKRKVGVVGSSHRVTKQESMHWVQQKFDGVLLPAIKKASKVRRRR